MAAGWVHAMADDAGKGVGKAAPGRRVDRTAQPEDLMLVLPAVPASVRAARTRIRHWLDCLTCPLPVAEDVELGVNEAIANVVDHAYPPDAPGQANGLVRTADLDQHVRARLLASQLTLRPLVGWLGKCRAAGRTPQRDCATVEGGARGQSLNEGRLLTSRFGLASCGVPERGARR